MLKAALLENMPTRQTVNGTRQFVPLTPNVKPLPTLPPIVGNTWYRPSGNRPGPGPIDKMMRTPEQLDAWYRQRYGVAYTGETPGTKFYRTQVGSVRDLISTPVSTVSEPNQFNPSRQ